jgi:Tol biopolymer transport system component
MLRWLILGACVLALACGDAGTPTGVGVPTNLLVVSGDTQTGTVGEPLPEPLVVSVTDTRGTGVAEVEVTFSVSEGEVALSAAADRAAGQAGSQVSDVTVWTDAQGRASVTWTLGTSAGEHTANASVTVLGSVTFTATARPGEPDTLEKVSGDDQVGLVGLYLPQALTVRVRDRFGNAVPGVGVAWSLTGVAGRIPDTIPTSTNGEAAAVAVLEQAGDYQVTAEIASVGTATFTGTALDVALAFSSFRDGIDNGDIYVTDVDGRAVSRLTDGPGDDGRPAWSPDGSTVAFHRRHGLDPFEIYVMNSDGTDERNLTDHPANDRWPTWSPDGSKIAFYTNRDGNYEIYVLNVATGFVSNLTNHPSDDEMPAWSPDGSKIVFVTDRDGNWEIYVMNANGSGQTNLTNHAAEDECDPAWSPDSKRIVFGTDRDGNLEIYVMDADGSNPVRLTEHWAPDEIPAWSPDGLLIAFMSTREDFLVQEVYIMNADGTGLRNLTNSPGWDSFPAWKP